MNVERLADLLFSAPQRWVAGGRAVALGALGLTVLGAFARVMVEGTAAIRALHPGGIPLRSLAELVPTVPTWWVPETPMGFALCAVVFVSGVVAVLHGRHLKSLLEA